MSHHTSIIVKKAANILNMINMMISVMSIQLSNVQFISTKDLHITIRLHSLRLIAYSYSYTVHKYILCAIIQYDSYGFTKHC